MIDPNNVLIRCPNGHELQAARADLDKPLACPVCNVTFTPAVGQVSQAETAGGAGGTEGAVAAMDYAAGSITKPIRYPGYTNWMLGLWLAVTMLSAIMGLYKLGSTSAGDQVSPSGGLSMLGGVYGCFSGLAGATTIVLQLMWIYRIHKDARRGRNYQSVSPGLALGLSFIPAFNYAWTAWTMKKLAGFAAGGDCLDDSKESQAIRATGLCLVAGIVLALASCLTTSLVVTTVFDVIREGGLQNQKVMQERLAKSIPFTLQVISPLISVTCVLFYFRAVRSLEAALYPFLGAPNR